MSSMTQPAGLPDAPEAGHANLKQDSREGSWYVERTAAGTGQTRRLWISDDMVSELAPMFEKRAREIKARKPKATPKRTGDKGSGAA